MYKSNLLLYHQVGIDFSFPLKLRNCCCRWEGKKKRKTKEYEIFFSLEESLTGLLFFRSHRFFFLSFFSVISRLNRRLQKLCGLGKGLSNTHSLFFSFNNQLKQKQPKKKNKK